jgi:hypothetical protein
MADPIQEEIWKFREEHAKRFNYDVHAIFEDIRRSERERGAKLVDLSKKRTAKPRKQPTAKRRTNRAA